MAIPYRKARSSSSGIMAIFFWRPAASQKAMRMNFTSSSAAYCLISSTEYCILSPPFRYGFRMHARRSRPPHFLMQLL